MSQCLRVLIITADQSVCLLATSVLKAEGHQITCVAEPQQALALLKNDGLQDVVLFDTSRQPPSNIYLLETLARSAGAGKLCLLAPLGMDLWKKDAERLGIQHTLRKPLQRHDMEQLLTAMGRQVRAVEAPLQACDSAAACASPYYLEELTGGRYFLAACPPMLKIYSTLRMLALVDVPVLILGESGVGKDVIASLLHKHSLRSQESYLSVNCAALPSDLLESELFGYEAGAFTGAVKAKPGKFELANHGTLLLDEIGEMSAPMQAKLLHVLQDGRFSRLGGRTATQVDVRVAAATNINIEDAIAEHAFREDLYYRISAFTLTIPPVRERREEIPFFVDEMIRRHAATFRLAAMDVGPQLTMAMQEYGWPGNLRELSNFVIRMLILQDPRAALTDLENKMRSRSNSCLHAAAVSVAGAPLPEVTSMRSIVRNFKDQTESRLIQEALDAVGWNRRHAAVQLQISYRALLYKIQHYNLREASGSLHVRSR